jgi:hypothetical protein
MYRVVGRPPNVRFEYVAGYPDLLNHRGTDRVNRYYNFGILALDDTIYQFLSTPNHPFDEPEPRFVGAKLIYSPDRGATWHNQDGTSPVNWEPWDERSRASMLFYEEPGDAFSLITVLQMGRNYEHNADGFVHLYAPNGNTEGTMNQLALCRAPRERLLDRSAYQFFTGQGLAGAAEWSPDIAERGVLHEFPPGWVNTWVHPYAWHPCVVYYPATAEFLMANWGMGCGPSGEWFGKPSYLGFWTARHPWGPWTQVHEELAWTPDHDPLARAYQPQVAPKWVAPDGRSFWLVWTDYQQVPGGGRPYYAFNAQQAEVTLG